MVKAVRGLLASVSSTCQCPDYKSRLVKIVAPSKQSKEFSILGRLCASLIVQLLSFLKSIQNHRTTIFLMDQYYWTCPRASRSLYSPYVQHFLQMLPNLFILKRGYSLISFFKGCFVIQFDAMLNQRGFTQLVQGHNK